MGMAEIYLAIGLFVAILMLISLWSTGFDDAFEEISGQKLSLSYKIFMVGLTILIWPYTVFRLLTLMREDDE